MSTAATFAAAASPALGGAAHRPSAASVRSSSKSSASGGLFNKTNDTSSGTQRNVVVAASSDLDATASRPRQGLKRSRTNRNLRGPPACASAAAATDAPAAVAPTQAEFDALFAWLTSNGVDTSGAAPRFMDDKPGGRGWGLVAAKDMSANETALSVPKSLWAGPIP